jgi:hypothetical protein
MNMHQQAVHGKEYVGYCVDCGKGFKSNLGYSIHKKMHEGEKDAFEQCYLYAFFLGEIFIYLKNACI